MKRFKKLLCKIFGHKYDDVDLVMLRIKRKAINNEDFKDDIIRCERCLRIKK